jgi:hypothetical protein
LQRLSSPVTAAGPSPACTEFPFTPLIEHLDEKYLQDLFFIVKRIMVNISNTEDCGIRYGYFQIEDQAGNSPE